MSYSNVCRLRPHDGIVGEGIHFCRVRRVTGYLTRDYKTTFNKGKQQETEMRYKHSNRLAQWKTS